MFGRNNSKKDTNKDIKDEEKLKEEKVKEENEDGFFIVKHGEDSFDDELLSEEIEFAPKDEEKEAEPEHEHEPLKEEKIEEYESGLIGERALLNEQIPIKEDVSIEDFEAEFEDVEDEEITTKDKMHLKLEADIKNRLAFIFIVIIAIFFMASISILIVQLYNFKMPGFIEAI
ncbi:hypothetical protein KKC59_01070, partial [bacterium]|nr:hypothetical protein [bacterium]